MNWPPPWVSVQLRRAITLDGRNYPVGAVLRNRPIWLSCWRTCSGSTSCRPARCAADKGAYKASKPSQHLHQLPAVYRGAMAHLAHRLGIVVLQDPAPKCTP
jgi:hypothetical protein